MTKPHKQHKRLAAETQDRMSHVFENFTKHTWKDLEDDGKRTICTWDVGILCQARAKRFRELKKKSRQEWQLDSPAREYASEMLP